MSADVSTGTHFNWPLPPSLYAANGRFPENRDCVVEYGDGRIVGMELLTFEPERDSISARVAGRADTEVLDPTRVRMIKLSAQSNLVRHPAAAGQVGNGQAASADERTFLIRFRDHRTLSGKTRGFVRQKSGLFLFLPRVASELTTACFIPEQQLQDVKIDATVDEVEHGKDADSSKVLAAELNRQASQRQELLRKLLADRAVTSADELLRALQRQKEHPKKMLGTILADEGLITQEQLGEALHIQMEQPGRRLGDILVDMGAVTVRLVQIALNEKLGIPYVNVREFKIDPTTVDLLDAQVAIKHQVLPLLLSGHSLVVAVENPLLTDFAQDVRFATGLTIVPVIANPEDIRARITKEYLGYGRNSGGADLGTALEAGNGPRAGDLSNVRVEDLALELSKEELLTAGPIKDIQADPRVTDNALVRLVNKIIIEAHSQGASDIHIESNPGNKPTLIRFRKDGELENYLELLPIYRNALISRIKIMAGMDISEHRHSQDGKIDFSKHGPLSIELRAALVPTANGLEDIVLRILGGMKPLPLNELGLAEHDIAGLKKMVTRSFGLILACGPTGSGKTTTLHSLLHYINRPDIKIWTAEDPIEITQAGLRQVQINSKIDWTFAAAMRIFLRADPDVIMVGEMRDVETTKIGIEASLTGHLVFSTLHTNTAAESVVRLLELGMDPFNFSDALIGILSQRLARKLCSKCKRAHPAGDGEISALAVEYCAGSKLEPAVVLARWRTDIARDGKIFLHEAVGCDACKDGYRGRIGVYELLSGTDQIKALIRNRGTVPQIVEAAQAGGMRLLRQDAIDKVLSGALDLASARAASS